MSKHTKKIITILIIAIVIVIATISTILLVRYLKNKKTIDTVKEIYSDENVQDRINSTNNDELLLQIDGEEVIGVIKIDKIKFEGLIYEGTSLDTLDKGVGHFENSSYLDGNVCLAAHNSNKFWAKLNTLQNGDKITYTSFLGTREYQVTNVTKISETDWSLLEDTQDNILTLITCVKGVPNQRYCIQAIAIN